MAAKFRIYQRIRRLFERDVILQTRTSTKSFIGEPQPTITEYNIKAAILNQKTGYKLNSLALDNERQNTDLTMDIYFHEDLEIEPKVKDIVLWNGKKYQINKLEDNRITSDFWKGEIVELSKQTKRDT